MEQTIENNRKDWFEETTPAQRLKTLLDAVKDAGEYGVKKLLHLSPVTTFTGDGPFFIEKDGRFIDVIKELDDADLSYEGIHAELVQYILDSVYCEYVVKTDDRLRKIWIDDYLEDPIEQVADEVLDDVAISLGWIRGNTGTSGNDDRLYFIIPSNSTEQQLKSAYDILVQYENKRDDYIIYFYDNNATLKWTAHYYFQDVSPERFLQIARRYVNTGMKPLGEKLSSKFPMRPRCSKKVLTESRDEDKLEQLIEIINKIGESGVLKSMNAKTTGTTSDSSPQFITRDGKFLDVDKVMSDNGDWREDVVHADFIDYMLQCLYYDYIKKDEWDEYYDWLTCEPEDFAADNMNVITEELGWVRANPGNSYVESRLYFVIPDNVTDAQLQSIYQFLIENEKSEYQAFFIGKNYWHVKYKMDEVPPEKFVQIARRFVNTGMKPLGYFEEIY